MRRLTYTLIGEGFAEYAFIKKYLEIVAESKQIRAVSSGQELTRGSKAKVYNELLTFYIRSFVDNYIDLFIAGVDLDEQDFELDVFNAEINRLKARLGSLYNKYKQKTILFVPIQAIDCWILYQKYKIDRSAKSNDNSLESRSKNDIKRAVYNNTQPGRQIIERVATQIAERADFDELARQSKSFNKFHEQVKNFIQNF